MQTDMTIIDSMYTLKNNLGQLYENDPSSQEGNDIYHLTTVSKRAEDQMHYPHRKLHGNVHLSSGALLQSHYYWPTVFRLIKHEWHKGLLLTLINGKPRPRFSRDSGYLSASEVNGNYIPRDEWLDRET